MAIKGPRYLNQTLCEIAVDTPVPFLVGVGQRGALDWTTEAGVVKLLALRGQTYFDVAQAFAVRKLGKGHGEKLIPARERTHTLVATIASHATIEFVVRNKADELRKHGSTLVQGLSPSQLIAKE